MKLRYLNPQCSGHPVLQRLSNRFSYLPRSKIVKSECSGRSPYGLSLSDKNDLLFIGGDDRSATFEISTSRSSNRNIGTRKNLALPPDQSDLSVQNSDDPGDNVEVEFILNKACMFGQSFYVIGEEQSLGRWDVTDARLMQWGKGDIWSTKIALPGGLKTEFKYLLKGKRGELVWQPGSNNVLEVPSDAKSLRVIFPWKDEVSETAADDPQVIVLSTNALEARELTEGGVNNLLAESNDELSDPCPTPDPSSDRNVGAKPAKLAKPTKPNSNMEEIENGATTATFIGGTKKATEVRNAWIQSWTSLVEKFGPKKSPKK